MQRARYKLLARPAVSQITSAGTGSFDPEKAPNRDAPLRRSLPRKRGLHFSLRARRAYARFQAPEPPLSLVASLAILALVAAWLSMVLRWSSGSMVVDQSQGITLLRFVAEDSRGDRILRLFGVAMFAMAGLLSALASQRPRLPRLVFFLLAAMIIYSLFWWLLSYRPSEYWPDLIGTNSPLTFMMCLGVFAGFDRTLWGRLRPVSLAISYGSAALAAYYTLRLSIRGSFEGANPTVEHLQIAFWFGLCALVLCKSSRWRDCAPPLISLAACIPMSIIIGSRSFTLLTMMGLVTGLMVPLQQHLKRVAVKVIALGLVTTIVFAGSWWVLSVAAPEQIQALKDRMMEDTRSSQYLQFFDQVPVLGLLTGLGPKATYTYGERTNYDYLDNQFLFILFKFGLPVLLGYFAVVLWPGLRLLFKPASQQQRLAGVVFAFWTLAALGVSIFHNITVDPQNLVIILMAGGASASKLAKIRPNFLPRELDLRSVRGNASSGLWRPRPAPLTQATHSRTSYFESRHEHGR